MNNYTLKDKAAIVGIGETKVGKLDGSTSFGLMAEAAKYAIEDAGMKKDDIDGVLTGGVLSQTLARVNMQFVEYTQIFPRYGNTLGLGGAAQASMAIQAAMAVTSGLANAVLCVGGDNLLTALTGKGATERMARERHPIWEIPYGFMSPAALALVARRHMHEYGTTSEQLAMWSVVCRKHASMNPSAMFRDPITVEDVINSKMIADPNHILDCAAISDGAGAFVVTSAERAKDLRKPPVYLMGAGEGHTHEYISGVTGDLATFGTKKSGKEAFKMAGVSPKDVDVAEIYDPYTIIGLINLECLGFCEQGESGPFIEEGRIELGGEIPVNTHGGLISHAHIGQPAGIFHVTEAVTQLRGEAGERQVKDAKIALAHGTGGMAGCHSTIILRR